MDYSEKYAGIVSNDWALCTVANATYTDCPIAPDTDEFVVTSYNPSTVTQSVQTFKVPPAVGYDVEIFDFEAKDWQAADSTLLCYDYLENNA